MTLRQQYGEKRATLHEYGKDTHEAHSAIGAHDGALIAKLYQDQKQGVWSLDSEEAFRFLAMVRQLVFDQPNFNTRIYEQAVKNNTVPMSLGCLLAPYMRLFLIRKDYGPTLLARYKADADTYAQELLVFKKGVTALREAWNKMWSDFKQEHKSCRDEA